MPTSYSQVMSKEYPEIQPAAVENTSSFRQYLAACTCSILAFLYGHTVGWSSAAVPQFQDGILPDGPVSQDNIGWVGGALCLGALVTSPLPGILANAKGRKFAAYFTGVTFLISWGVMLAAQNYWYVLVARFFSGIGSAGSITIVSIYNNEVAEPQLKASLGGLMVVGYSSGILFAYILGAWVEFSYVIIIYLCITVAFFPAWWFMPESPAHHLLHGSDKEALRSLEWLLGTEGSRASDALGRLRKEQAGAIQPASITQFFRDPAARKGFFLAIILSSVLTFCGVFAVLSYANSILSKTGGGLSPTAGSIMYGSIMVAGSMMPPLIADRMPRKVIIGISCTVLTLGMATLATFQYLQTTGLDLSQPGSFLGMVPIIVLTITVFFHFTGLGSVTYITIMELFSDENRGIAGSMIAIVIWGTSFILLQFFGMAVDAFGDYCIFYFFSGVCAFGLFFVIIFFPETRGKSSNEIAAILLKRR